MSKISSRSPLNFQLVPMKQPEAIAQLGGGSTSVASEGVNTSDRHSLLVHPGESSHTVLHIANPTTVTQEIEVEIRGDFPARWCRWNLEGREIRPQEEMLMGIYFEVPADFWEYRETESNKSTQLNYQCQICVRSHDSASPLESTIVDFNLYLRPRSLYLEFLPAIYREIDLMGRLLKVFEDAFEPAVHSLNSLWAYLDPITAPETLLPFLSYWVGWSMIPGIDICRQRYLIRNAIELYRWRGTKRGLRFYLHLYTGLPLDEDLAESNKHICIEESLGEGFILGEASLGRETVLGGGRAYHFDVRMRTIPESPLLNETLIRTIIEGEKPAWCTYNLYLETVPN